jgi:hypothetical protein
VVDGADSGTYTISEFCNIGVERSGSASSFRNSVPSAVTKIESKSDNAP